MEAIDAQSNRLTEFARDIWAHPELGFKETRTATKVAEYFEELGLAYRDKIAITGVRADVEGARDDLRMAIFGELDAVTCREHPDADPDTAAIHACGHHAQLAVMMGTAIALASTGIHEQLGAGLSFIAVPAEEFIELEYREQLKEQGKLEFFGGKQELIRLGELDDVNLAAMVHSAAELPERKVQLAAGNNGFVAKTVRYRGQEAHAGAAPFYGVNALNAAMLGLMGIHAQRETFKDEDSIRVHPIITRGGDLVNIVPADVAIETYVRGKKTDAILDASAKVNRALQGGAYAIGAEVDITELPGYLPMRSNPTMNDLFAANAAGFIGEENVARVGFRGGSTDMGDISHLMPAIHPYIGGIEGRGHARDFRVVDEEMAWLIPAKIMAATVIDLLWDDGREAEAVIADFEPVYGREDYLQMWRDTIEG